MYEQIRIVWIRVLVLPKSDGDKGFLERMDKAWRYLFMVAAALISPLVPLLLMDFNTRILSVFLLLLGTLVLPFVVEILGIISESAKIRFYSWAMIILCICGTANTYLYGGVLRPLLRTVLVPYVMSLSDFMLLTGLVISLITYGSMHYALRRLSRHFRANLKSELYREQIPDFHNGVGRTLFSMYIGYTAVGFFAIWYLLH